MLQQYDARFPYYIISNLGCWLQRRRSSPPVSMVWIRWDLSFEHRHLWTSLLPLKKNLWKLDVGRRFIPLIFKDGLWDAHPHPMDKKRHWRWQKSLNEWQRILNDKVLLVIFFFFTDAICNYWLGAKELNIIFFGWDVYGAFKVNTGKKININYKLICLFH